MPGGRFAKGIDGLDRVLEAIEQRAQLSEQPLAGVGRRDAAGGAVEKPDAEMIFERAHGLAQRRSGQTQPPRRLGKACLFGDGHEGIELGKSSSAHSFQAPEDALRRRWLRTPRLASSTARGETLCCAFCVRHVC